MNAITPVEQERRLDRMVRLIWEKQQQERRPVTIREIARALSYSNERAHKYLTILRERGIVTYDPGRGRTTTVRVVGRDLRTGRLYRLVHSYTREGP